MDSTDIVKSTDDVVDSTREAYYGTPGLAIDTAYVKATLDTLIVGAKNLRGKSRVNKAMLEDPITYLLDGEMKIFQRSSGSDIVRWQIQPSIQGDPEDPLVRYEPDFSFSWEEEEMDPDLHLYVEAKRLFGTGPSLAGKYVEQGVLDFVEARYGRNHNYGVMMGYVLAGPLAKAVRAVKGAYAYQGN